MKSFRWKRVGLKLMSGLAACLLTASLQAQSPQSEGVVRISDRPRPVRTADDRIRQASLRTSQAAPNEYTQRGYLLEPAPYAADSVPEHAMTGNPVTDLYRTVTMRSASSSQMLSGTTGLLSPNNGLFSRSHGCGSCDSCQQTAYGDCPSCYGGEFECHGHHHGHHGHTGRGRSARCIDRFLRRIHEYELACKRRLLGYFMPDGCCGQGCPPMGHYHLSYSANPRYFDPRDGGVYAAQGFGVPMAVPLAPNVRHTYNYSWGIPSSRLTPVSTPAPF